jgi:hypothetical protein
MVCVWAHKMMQFQALRTTLLTLDLALASVVRSWGMDHTNFGMSARIANRAPHLKVPRQGGQCGAILRLSYFCRRIEIHVVRSWGVRHTPTCEIEGWECGAKCPKTQQNVKFAMIPFVNIVFVFHFLYRYNYIYERVVLHIKLGV